MKDSYLSKAVFTATCFKYTTAFKFRSKHSMACKKMYNGDVECKKFFPYVKSCLYNMINADFLLI